MATTLLSRSLLALTDGFHASLGARRRTSAARQSKDARVRFPRSGVTLAPALRSNGSQPAGQAAGGRDPSGPPWGSAPSNRPAGLGHPQHPQESMPFDLPPIQTETFRNPLRVAAILALATVGFLLSVLLMNQAPAHAADVCIGTGCDSVVFVGNDARFHDVLRRRSGFRCGADLLRQSR